MIFRLTRTKQTEEPLKNPPRKTWRVNNFLTKNLELFNLDPIHSESYYFLTPIIMRSFNKVMLMGHLAADPELRETKTGKKVVNFRMATNRIRMNNGEKQPVADFHRIVVWEGLGEICKKQLIKGSPVFIEGKIVNDNYEDATGNKHYTTEIVAENINIITYNKKNNDVELNDMRGEVAQVA